MPARSLRACATWLLQRPLPRWRGTRRSAFASWWPRVTRSPTTWRSRATARRCRGTCRSPGASSATTRRRLLELDSFGSACAAIESAELAGPYLEELGIDVPPDARDARRAGRDGLPVPPVDGLHRLLARR